MHNQVLLLNSITVLGVAKTGGLFYSKTRWYWTLLTTVSGVAKSGGAKTT